MIAYFALLSFVPLLFLSLALLSTAGQANQGSFFIRELQRTFPSTSLNSLINAVRAIRENATALGIFGGAFLAWSSLSLFSVLESAFNIVYGRPNRAFLRGKALATLLMVGSLAFLFASLVIGSIGTEIFKRYTGIGDSTVFGYALSVGVSLVGIFVFLGLTAYDNQKLKRFATAPNSDNLAVFGALMLYLDFINLFLFVLRLLGDRRR